MDGGCGSVAETAGTHTNHDACARDQTGRVRMWWRKGTTGMRCPICSAIVSGGGICQSCGAALPGGVAEPARTARRGNGLLRGAGKQKRAGTLGDFFRFATGSRAPERDPRPRQPSGSPPLSQRTVRGPAQGRARAPERTPPPRTPVSSQDPWAATYDAAARPAAPWSVPLAAAPFGSVAGTDAWQSEPGWGVSAPPAVAPVPYAPHDPYGATAGGWQQASDEAMRDISWGADLYAMSAPPFRSPARSRSRSRSRPGISGLSRMTLNALMFGLVLLILGVAILVGMRYIQSTQSQVAQAPQLTPTIVPTAVPPANFSGLQAKLYSVAYPSQWRHTSTSDPLGCGCSLSGESFSDGASDTFVIYTRLAAPADQLAQVLTQAAASVSPNQTPQALLLDQQHRYGGASWVENDYIITQVTGSTAVQLRVRVLVVNYNVTTYIVVASAPQSGFAHADSSYFEPMLRSLRLD